MKIIILLISFLWSVDFYAQEKNSINTSDEVKFKCDKFFYSNGVTEYSGNVNFKSELLELTEAEKIVYNQTTQELTATGLKKFYFDGTVEVKNMGKNATLRYTLGKKNAYLE